jgi:hypothetical protein
MSSFRDLGRFFNQPDALPVRAPKKNKNYIFLTTFDSFVIFYLGFLFFRIFFGVLYQAVRTVSKKRPKSPKLDIPFIK